MRKPQDTPHVGFTDSRSNPPANVEMFAKFKILEKPITPYN